MNWKKIKKECPKAWKLFCTHFNIDEGEMLSDWIFKKIDGKWLLWDSDHECGGRFEKRQLYDFFDEQGLIVSVWLHPQTRGHFTYTVYDSKNDNYCYVEKLDYGSSRIETETEAFTNSFQVLQSQSQR